jgi:regulator of protease activity HflC (stomatin/prohibitin superfamily)
VTAPPLIIPPGQCLTDIWPHLHNAARRRWLALVAVEARAVRAEARAAAAAETPPWNAQGATSAHAIEQEAIRRRREILYRDEGYSTITLARRAGWTRP